VRRKGKVDYEIIKENKVTTVHANRLKLVTDIDQVQDLDIYDEIYRTSEIELNRLENSIKTLAYEKQNKEKELNCMKQLYSEVADGHYLHDHDYEYEKYSHTRDPKNEFISFKYIKYNNLKWKPKNNNNNMILFNNIYGKNEVIEVNSTSVSPQNSNKNNITTKCDAIFINLSAYTHTI
jgi:hypothetical protein